MAHSWVQLCVLSVLFGSQVTKSGDVVMCRPASALE